jgi:hypothetical protein
MRYVQAGILVCLVLITGLLVGIYRSQQDSPAEPPAEASTVAQAEPLAVEPAAEQPAKPSPLPVKRPRTAAKPTRTQSAPEPSEPESAPVSARPDEMPPPVITPVVPNEPPLTETAPVEPPPPQPRAVTLPQGTVLAVRLVNTLSTKRNVAGDRFEASLAEPLVVDGWLVADKGSSVEGRVLESKEAGRVKGVSELSFGLVSLSTADGRTVEISTDPFTQRGDQTRGDDLKKVGIGAGIGAIIGAIAGGGKGAAIGAGAGAGAGGGAVLATRGEAVVIPTETQLSFRLDQPAEVMAIRPVSR